MIRNRKMRKFKREVLDKLPDDDISTSDLARAIGVSRFTIIRFKKAGLPHQTTKMAENTLVHVFKKKDVIRWFIQGGLAYSEEWGEEVLFDA